MQHRSLLQEASVDDSFNTQLSRIETSIEKLEGIVKQMVGDAKIKPTRSHISAIESAISELTALRDKLKAGMTL